jgi:UDP-2,4-diacetamido-2,4,6-trideoxy-beta-L-altropyranose hydrolase
MNVAVRADAGGEIGIGHLVRCLTLAATLREDGARVRLVARRLPAHLRRLVEAQRIELREIGGTPAPPAAGDLPHSHWLATTQEHDADETAAVLADSTWDWLVVDHYGLDARWHGRLRHRARGVLVIDDLADRDLDCDLLLDQNLVPELETRYDSRAPAGSAKLLGPTFALLRPEFAARRQRLGKRTGRVARLLVMLGGSNQFGEVDIAIDALDACGVPAADIVVVADVFGRARIEERCCRRGYAFHPQTDTVADLMATADLAIGATGATSWERCCLALPSLCITSAANQIPVARGLEAAGAIEYVGDASRVTSQQVSAALAMLIEHPGRLGAMSAAAARLVDGYGAKRVSAAMTDLNLRRSNGR